MSLLDASARMLRGEIPPRFRHPVRIEVETALEEVADRVAFIEAFGNVAVVATDDGLVMVDAAGPLHARAVYDAVRSWSDQPLHTAVFTHGHVDHIYAVRHFEAEGRPAHVIGHEAMPKRFRRYEETNGYNAVINQRQFQLGGPFFPGDYRYPDQTYRDRLQLTVGGVDFDLRHDRGETDDATWVWLADRKVLFTGDLFIWASPNCGNPQKVQRYPREWAVALRKMAELGPELLLPGHGLPIAGHEQINQVLVETAELLDSIVGQTLELMNAGATLNDIIHTVTPPAHLLERPWLQPVYDEPEFVVRNLWRLYGGWYDGDPSQLKPAPTASLAAELAGLAGGAQVLADRALELSDAGDHRLAGHLAQLAALAAPKDSGVQRVRATVFGRRVEAETSTMARGVFRWAEHESRAMLDPES